MTISLFLFAHDSMQAHVFAVDGAEDTCSAELGLVVSLKDKLTKINEKILHLRGAAQRVMTREEEVDDFLAPQNQINDVPVPVRQERDPGEKMVGMLVACIMKDAHEMVVETLQERISECTRGPV